MLTRVLDQIFAGGRYLVATGVLGLVVTAFASSITIIAPPYFPTPQVNVVRPPSFAITAKGIRHDLAPRYQSFFIGIWDDPAVDRYTYVCNLISGPPGFTVTSAGVVEWLPIHTDIGTSKAFSISITVFEAGQQIRAITYDGAMTVRAALPALRAWAPVITYERPALGGYHLAGFEGYEPSDSDRKLLRWSLVGAPPGVFINQEGGIEWPDTLGYARDEPYVFGVRVDHETALGWVSSETQVSHQVRPQAASVTYGELNPGFASRSGGMLGFSLAAGDGWLLAGEPFPSFASAAPGEPPGGRVRVWQNHHAGDAWMSMSVIEPDPLSGARAFGASVALAPATGTSPLRAVIGAPETARHNGATTENVGQVFVYTLAGDGSWQGETRLDSPVVQAGLYFGGWVAIDATTIIASLEGMAGAGPFTGALAVYGRENGDWQFSQLLTQ